MPSVKRVIGVVNIGGIRLSSSSQFRRKTVEQVKALINYVEEHPLTFLPDYSSLLGKNYSKLKRRRSKKEAFKLLEELIRPICDKYGDFRLIDVLRKTYERGVKYKVAELVDAISNGMTFNTWLGSKLCKELKGECIMEPSIIDVEPVMSFDILLLIKNKPMTYIEVKRSLKKRPKQWAMEEVVNFLIRSIRIFGNLGIPTRNIQKMILVLALFTPVTPSESVVRVFEKKTDDLRKELENTIISNVISGTVLWIGSYEEIGKLCEEIRNAVSLS